MKFHVSGVCSAFSSNSVGTRVTGPETFRELLTDALRKHDPSGDRTPGQHFVSLPDGAAGLVSAGVARRADVPEDGYLVRVHRGRADCYAQRTYAAKATGVAAVVYTREAYARDPEVAADEMATVPADATHVIVAVLAFAGPKAPLSPYRFVANLAGGNRDAETYTADEIRALARDVVAYDNEWIVVAG